MNEPDPDPLPNDEGDEGGAPEWNEFDCEQYLRVQDEAVAAYWRCYQEVEEQPDRIDEVARRLGWEPATEEADDSAADSEGEVDETPYTVHRNRVFVATRALFSAVHEAWQRAALDSGNFPPAQALPIASALREAELATVTGLQSLDLGDRALGIAQLKRALAHLNRVFACLPADAADGRTNRHLADFDRRVLPWIFDLREIFLRVVYECRAELGREGDGENDSGNEA